MENKNNQNLTPKILNKVKTEDIRMKSKTYFLLRDFLIVLSCLIVGLFVLYLVSFIVFSLKLSGAWFLPGFGLRGVGLFLVSLPWVLILLAVILIIVLELLVKYFAFAYRRPILYSILGIIGLLVLGGFVISQTSFHSGLWLKSRQNNLGLPMMKGVYKEAGVCSEGNLVHGLVAEVSRENFRLKSYHNGEYLIKASGGFISKYNIKPGDRLVVLLEKTENGLKVSKIRKIKKRMFNENPEFYHPMMKNHRYLK